MGALFTTLFSLYGKFYTCSSAPSAEPGFDEQFSPPLKDGLKCRCCYLGLRNPVQTHCGHRFCKGCIDESIRNKGQTCPVSGCEHSLGKSEPYPDNFAKQEILTWNVFCQRKRTDGCPWKGPLQDLEYHLETTCLFISVKCDCGCEIPRGDLQRHVATGCPRTKDWKLEAIERKADEDEVRPLPYPTEELDINSSPGQITGIRGPVEHHQGKEATSNVKQIEEAAGNNSESQQGQLHLHHQKEAGNEANGFDPPVMPKEPWSHQVEDDYKAYGKKGNGLDPPSKPKGPLAHQKEDGNETNGLDSPSNPKKPLTRQNEDGSKANGLDPPANPEVSDRSEANGSDLPTKPKEPLVHQNEDGSKANGLDTPVNPEVPDGSKANGSDLPTKPKEPLVHRKEDGSNANGLDSPTKPKEPDGSKANRSDPPTKPKEQLVHQKEDGNEANGLDPPTKPKQPDGSQANGSEPATNPKEQLAHQKEDGNEANGLCPPPNLNEQLAHQKEDVNEANGLDPPSNPNEQLGHQKEDGNEANGLEPPAKPSPCQMRDANGLVVSSQNHVPSFI